MKMAPMIRNTSCAKQAGEPTTYPLPVCLPWSQLAGKVDTQSGWKPGGGGPIQGRTQGRAEIKVVEACSNMAHI